MIIDKQPLPGDEVDLQDAPPSYDALDGVPPPPQDEKAGPSDRPLPPIPPTSSTIPTTTSTKYLPSVHAKRSGKQSIWFNFGSSSRVMKEVRSTLTSLLHDLVKQTDTSGALGVLESCADACKTYDLSLSTLLQEPNVGGHSPIYWAVIKRSAAPPQSRDTPSHPGDAPDLDLISVLLTRAAPLLDATIDELRLACLQTSDQDLFQRLRRLPAFSALTSQEEIILGEGVPPDDVSVENMKEDKSAFIMRVKFPMFQKRVMISGRVRIEFIAKGRLWELSFLVAKDFDKRLGYKSCKAGSWVVKLALLPRSPPTWVDSRLVIEDPRGVPSASSPTTTASATSLIGAMRERCVQEPQTKIEPRIELRLRAREQLTAPHAWGSMIVVPLEENEHANSLQFQDCPYLDSDGALQARLEARLAPPDTDCVIC